MFFLRADSRHDTISFFISKSTKRLNSYVFLSIVSLKYPYVCFDNYSCFDFCYPLLF